MTAARSPRSCCPQVLFKYCAEEVAQARHTALFQRFIKVPVGVQGCAGVQGVWVQGVEGGEADIRAVHR